MLLSHGTPLSLDGNDDSDSRGCGSGGGDGRSSNGRGSMNQFRTVIAAITSIILLSSLSSLPLSLFLSLALSTHSFQSESHDK